MRTLFEKTAALLHQVLEKKYLILNAMFAFLLFILFPCLIFLRGANLLFQSSINREISKINQQTESLLDQMALYANSDIFAHRLLYGLCSTKESGKRSLNEIPAIIRRLKGAYPDAFTFIVADRSGNLIEEYSDEKKFSYLYRQAFSFIFEFEKAGNSPPKEEVETRLKRLRPLLGDMMRPQDIHKPLLPQEHGRSILVSGAKKKFHLWYGSGKDFKILVFISRDFIRSTAGLEWFCKTNNSLKNNIVGFSEYPPNESQLKKFLADHQISKVALAIAENETINFSRNDSSLKEVVCRFLNQHYRGFCFRKKHSDFSGRSFTAKIAASIIKILLILFFILYVFQKKEPLNLTIKIKIAAFFAYSILLPILIIVSISGEIFSQQKEELSEAIGRQTVQFCRNLETRFSFSLEQTAEKLKAFISREYEKNPKFAQNRDWHKGFYETINWLSRNEELMLIDSEAKDRMVGFSTKLTTNTTLIRRFTADAMRLILNKETEKVNKKIDNPFFVAIGVHSNQCKITYLGIGELDLYAYTQFLTPPSRELEKTFATHVLWKKSSFQESFISEIIRPGFSMQNAWPAFYNIESKSLITSQRLKSRDNELLNFFRQSVGRQINFNRSLNLNGKEYIAVAMSGQKLDKTITALLYPSEIFEKEISRKIRAALFAAILILLFAAAGAWLLSDWIFKPLDILKSGMRAIADHNFNYKLEIVCQNEMGRLIKAFNNSIETLQDLEVARVVQESLLSNNFLKKNRLEIAAKSNIMTRLGGDYHDIVECGSDKIMVFIGDATGHGIPAAISMAMAKAVMLHETLDELDQTRLMGKLHNLFSRLRSQGVKDFMTATSVMLDSTTGRVNIINAGHCYPVLLKKDATEGQLLSQVKGLPPGFSRSLKLMPVTMQLEPGDILILFTDGLVESCNSTGELLGFTGLQKIVAETRSPELTEQLEKILNLVKQWESETNDDQTAILVKFE